MRVKYTFICIVSFFLCFLSGCGDKTVQIKPHLASYINGPAAVLECEDLTPSFENMESALRIIPAGPIFVVSNTQADTLMGEIRNRDGKLLRRFIRKGNGPGEFLSPIFVDGALDVSQDQVLFSFVDRHKGNLIRYRYQVNTNEIIEESEQQLPEVLVPLRRVLRTDKGYFVVVDNIGKEMIICDPTFNQRKRVEYADLDREMTLNESQFFQSAVSMSPDGKHIVLSYYSMPRIDILDSSGETERVIYYGKRFTLDDVAPSRYYFSSSVCDQENMYISYSDMKESRIFKMTWEGDIESVYDIVCLTNSVEDGFMYVLSENREKGNMEFKRYKLR